MRRRMFLVAATLVASTAALAATSAGAGVVPPTTYKWFSPTATAIAGPNHTVTLSVSLTNVGSITHTGIVNVTLLNAGSGFVYPDGPVFPQTIVLKAGQAWTWTAPVVTSGPGVQIGISVTATHVMQGSDLGRDYKAVGASASAVSR